MRAHPNVTVAKKKKALPAENRQETAICPNCHYHFKVKIQPQNYQLIAQINDLIYFRMLSVQGTPKTSQKMYEQLKDLEESRDILPSRLKEDILIESIRDTRVTNLQKLKKLNDLNRLKKSRYRNQEQTRSNYSPLQGSHSGEGRQSFGFGIKAPISLEKSKEGSGTKGKQSPSRVSQLDKQWLTEYAVCNYEEKILLQRLVEWIETSFKRDNLPYHLKMMIANYLSLLDCQS